MKAPTIRTILTWSIPLVVMGLVVYKTKFAPVSVLAHTIGRGEIVVETPGTGTLEARVKTTISARIQERLLEVLVDQGDKVKSGQLLARLDAAEAMQQVAIAEASLAAAKQTVGRVHADLARSEAVLAQARLEHKRMTELTSSRAVSQSDADKAGEALRIAEADINRSRAAIGEAEGLMTVANKNLLFRQEQLAFTEIRAPYDGLVIRRDRDAGEMLLPGASLLHMISLEEIWVSAWVDETAMSKLKTGQASRIVFRSQPDHAYPGQVSRLGREADRETREFLVDVRATGLPENWTIGQRAEVSIETARLPDQVLLPAAFLAWKVGGGRRLCPAAGQSALARHHPG